MDMLIAGAFDLLMLLVKDSPTLRTMAAKHTWKVVRIIFAAVTFYQGQRSIPLGAGGDSMSTI